VQRAGYDIGKGLADSTKGVTVVIRSTVPPGTLEQVLAPALVEASGRPATAGPSAGDPREIGLALTPEFLREGTSIEDFTDPPFTVIGTEHEPSIERLREVFGFIDRPFHVVPTRATEGLKYACNAFHALKVSFTNELSRLFRHLDVDSRQVMKLFVEDDRLNISPAYLRPGFAFGGSCLPKDVRTLLYLGRREGIDLPVLSGTLSTNQWMIADAVDLIQRTPARKVTLIGLSFKAATDDLRESPYVELAERLIGKGFDLRIHDPIIQPDRLVGANRRFVEQRLPHLHRLLTTSLVDSIEGAEAVVVAAGGPDVVAALLANPPAVILDLTGRLGAEVEALPGYQGIGW
jgi:GDP-mannose 6-dehydrogenase